jgi:hypothetical protein
LALLLSLAGSASAAGVIIDPSPETALLEQAVALQGAEIPQSELQQRMANAIQAYDQTSPLQGREERMASALESMGIMSSQRVAEMRASIHAGLTDSSLSEGDAIDHVVRSTLLHAGRGAEFSSGCAASLEWGAGFAVISLGLFYFSHDIKMLNKSNYGNEALFIQSVSEYAAILGGAALIVVAVVEVVTAGC